jgi:predicted kinase
VPPQLVIPDPSLVVLIGVTGAGKSTFAARHFSPTEVLSSDRTRAWVADDENDLGATEAAFEIVHLVADRRLAYGRLTVVDATNVLPDSRAPLVALASERRLPAVALVFDMPEAVIHERRLARPDRRVGPAVVRQQLHVLRRSLGRLEEEGFDAVFVVHDVAEVDAAEVVRQPVEQGPA